MQNKSFSHWFDKFQQQAFMLNERRLVVLSGTESWASDLLSTIDKLNGNEPQLNTSNCLVYGDGEYIKSNLSKQRFRDKLGTESDIVIFNYHTCNGDELSVDALTALSGTLVAGGIFFLLINERFPTNQSLFYQRFFRLLNDFPEHVVLDQTEFSLPLPTSTPANQANSPIVNQALLAHGCVTKEQVNAVEATMKVLTGKRNRPLVLTADRGRGKSSALAIACANLLMSATPVNKLQLVVTSADVDSLTIFFTQLSASLPSGEWRNNKYIAEHGSVEFIAIDQLLKTPIKASLVLVDEAAGIPIYLLEQLLKHYSRLVFASTIHGYEGAGRGFTLKFQQTLTKNFPYWQSLHINEPIRWRVDDPLEQLMFNACLLNAELPSVNELTSLPQSLIFKRVNAADLVANESLLKQVFSVLVTAHYQTKPSDVKMLLDNPNVQLVCLISTEYTQQTVIAVALLMNEGRSNNSKITSTEINAINQSQRRLKNNFVPQSLLTQCGIEYAFDFHYLRVMRIAVHPQVQDQGVGTYFLEKIATFSVSQGADFLASSFGVTQTLLSFWLNSRFQLARIGFSKDKASGEHSALVLKALSSIATKALKDINTEFYRTFDYLLTDEYQTLTTELVGLILQHCPQSSLALLSQRDIANIESFSQGHRQYSSCVFSLHLWLKHQLAMPAFFDDKTAAVFISRILQKHSITDVCSTNGFTGKKALEQYLRSQITSIIDAR